MEREDLRITGAARRYLTVALLLIAASSLSGCFTAGVLKMRKDCEIEAYFGGTETIVMVTYDGADRVEKVEYFKGGANE